MAQVGKGRLGAQALPHRSALEDRLVRGQQLHRGLAEEGRGRTPGHVPEAGTQIGIAALVIDLPDAVAGRLDQGAKALIALAQGLLELAGLEIRLDLATTGLLT